MIRKISGKTKSPSYTHLNHPVAETKSTSKFDIAVTLGETFLNNSCSRNYSEKFQKVEAEQEKIKLNFKSANTEEYNNLFNFDELLDAIKQSHDSATGPDEIHYQMLKHLPKSSLQALLGIFNQIWTTGVFPEDWRLATVIPIPKPGKYHAEPTNFRPIALADRTMQVRVGSTLSDLYDLEQGVPQGGVLSTTLFNIKINDIVKCLDNLTDCCLYVDDFCICFRSKSMRTIERHLQQNLNKIEHWATNNGFKFSKSKHSVYISVSCESNMMIQFLHYMDRLFLLYRKTNILV